MYNMYFKYIFKIRINPPRYVLIFTSLLGLLGAHCERFVYLNILI